MSSHTAPVMSVVIPDGDYLRLHVAGEQEAVELSDIAGPLLQRGAALAAVHERPALGPGEGVDFMSLEASDGVAFTAGGVNLEQSMALELIGLAVLDAVVSACQSPPLDAPAQGSEA